jgi:hypothetical protein
MQAGVDGWSLSIRRCSGCDQPRFPQLTAGRLQSAMYLSAQEVSGTATMSSADFTSRQFLIGVYLPSFDW